MQKVLRRKKWRKGKPYESKSYYLRYRLDDMPVERWVSLRTTDSTVAQKKASEFLQTLERQAAGIIDAPSIREGAKKGLRLHLEDFIKDLYQRNRAGRDGKGAKLLQSRISTLFDECGWNVAAHITSDSFVHWRNNRRHNSARTLNHYLEGMNSFLNWMVQHERIKANPLARVAKADEHGKETRRRRALNDEELCQLVQASGARGLIYLVAARTGLRQGELRQLIWADLHLE